MTRLEQRRMERARAKIISMIFVIMALLIAFMLGYYFGGTAEAAEEPVEVSYIPDKPKVVILPEIEEPEEPEPPTLTSIGEFTLPPTVPVRSAAARTRATLPTASLPAEQRPPRAARSPRTPA